MFLAERPRALLADQPRVGKTGAAIMAADYILAKSILVVTTASGRAVWRRAFPEWSDFGRSIGVITGEKQDASADVVVVGWASVANPKIRSALLRRQWTLLILDESHYAKNPETRRTEAIYGPSQALFEKATNVWCLTGTPMPNAPNDLWPMMNALCPDRLSGLDFDAFMKRYCIVKMKKLSNFRKIPVVIGGKNLQELRARLGDFALRRTQQDVGIVPPVYETFPLIVSDKMKRDAEKGVDAKIILAAAEAGDTKKLEMHLGPLRRHTGAIKAGAVVDAVKEEFECGLDKIVLAHWHTETGHMLRDGLSEFGVVQIEGATSPHARAQAEERFRDDPNVRVFVAQIAAAGEAIDLSAASELMFVETSFVPKDMLQMAMRITNVNQVGLRRVRVAVLEGSIDEAVEQILMRKWSAIREVIQ